MENANSQLAQNPVIKVIDLVPGATRELPSMPADGLTAEVFWRDYVLKHRPLIIRQGAGHWPAVGKWNRPGYLESIPSAAKVWLSRTFNPIQINVMLKRVQVGNIRDCVSEMRGSADDQTYSMTGIPVPAEWEGDLGAYGFIGAERFAKQPRNYMRRRMFIYKNAASDWHYHLTDETLTTQLSGKKRFSLFRLDASNWSACSGFLEANMHHLSCARELFPPRLALTKYEGVLEVGDVIYIPPFWWHGVDPEDAQVGVTLAHCFRTPWQRFGDARDPITQSMIASGPKPKFRFVPAMQFSPLMRGAVALSSLLRRIRKQEWYEPV